MRPAEEEEIGVVRAAFMFWCGKTGPLAKI